MEINAKTAENYVEEDFESSLKSGSLRASPDGKPCQSPSQCEDTLTRRGSRAYWGLGTKDDEIDHRPGGNDS